MRVKSSKRPTRSASSSAKINSLKDKPKLELPQTDYFSTDDIDLTQVLNISLPSVNKDLDQTPRSYTSKSTINKRIKSASFYDSVINEEELYVKAERVKYEALPERPKSTIKIRNSTLTLNTNNNNNNNNNNSVINNITMTNNNNIKFAIPKILINDLFNVNNNNSENGSNKDFRPADSIKEEIYEETNEMTDFEHVSNSNKTFDKMGRYENFDFHMPPLDPEYKAYVKQKKNLREKIQDHWKLELNIHSLQKGAPLNRINDSMYKPDQQWITINTAPYEDEIMSSKDKKLCKSAKTSLIDTFTADIDNPNTEKLETYRVKGEVGTLIAQKLINGEKMRICRNGEPVHQAISDENSEYAFMIDTNNKKSSYVKIFDDIPVPRSSILSWKDQVNKNNIKIIEPTIAEIKEEKKIKPERTLIVKKLTEEEAYKPKIKKSPLELKEFAGLQKNVHNNINNNNNNNIQPFKSSNGTVNNMDTGSKRSVEIVGVSRKGTLTDFNTNNQKDDNLSKLNEPEFILGVALVPAKPNKSLIKPYENLTEKNYSDLIDNLTSRFRNDSAKPQDPITRDIIDSKRKNKKVNTDKTKQPNLSLDFTNNKFGLNLETNSLPPKSTNKHLIKNLEKKYKTLIYHEAVTNNLFNNNLSQKNSSTVSSSPQSHTHKDLSPRVFDPRSRPISSSTSSIKKIYSSNFNAEALNNLNDNLNLKLSSFNNGLFQYPTLNSNLNTRHALSESNDLNLITNFKTNPTPKTLPAVKAPMSTRISTNNNPSISVVSNRNYNNFNLLTPSNATS